MFCDPGEGCGCVDCNAQQAGCPAGLVCYFGTASCQAPQRHDGPRRPPQPAPVPTPVPITECFHEISGSGSYVVAGNLSLESNGTCIRVAADDVNLDCNGSALRGFSPEPGEGGCGISLENVSNVTVANCSISGFGYAISLLESDGSLVTNNSADSNGEGLRISGSHGVNVFGNNFTGNGCGMCFAGSSSINVENNSAEGNFHYGIHLYDSRLNVFRGSVVSGNPVGLRLNSSADNIFGGNDFSGNQAGVEALDFSNANAFQGNSVTGSGWEGVKLSNSSDNDFTDNNVTGSGGFDFYCVGNESGNESANIDGGNACGEPDSCFWLESCAKAPVSPPSCAPDWVVGACGCILNVPGKYTINGSGLTLASGNICVQVTASDVVLDCRGANITGPATASKIGVRGASAHNVTVKNCDVHGFGYGIGLALVQEGLVTGNNASGASTGGIIVSSGTGNMIEGNRADSSKYGLVLNLGGNNTVANNDFTLNGEGVYVTNSDNNTIEGNAAWDNEVGFTFRGMEGNSVSGNNASNNTEHGFHFIASHGNNFTDNTVLSNNETDFECDSTYYQNNDLGNTCENRDSCRWVKTCPAPMEISSCPYEINSTRYYTLSGNLSMDASGPCIRITANYSFLNCSGSTITGSSSGEEGGYGIEVDNAIGVWIDNCTVTNFTYGFGLLNATSCDLNGNSAHGNTEGLRVTEGLNALNYITLNNFSGNTNGLSIVNSWSNYVEGNTLNDNSDSGVYSANGTYTIFKYNTLDNNHYGFYCTAESFGSAYEANNITGNFIGVSLLNGSNYTHFLYNNITGNGDTGVYLSSSNDSDFRDNNVTGNAMFDFYCANGESGNATANTDYGNTCDNPDSCMWVNSCTNPPATACDTVIGECGCTISVQDNYRLEGNLSGNGTCVTVNGGGNVSTIHCDGHSISGNGSGAGFLLNGTASITLEDCVVDGFEAGIELVDSNAMYLGGNNVSSNHYGFLVFGGPNTIEDNIAAGNMIGIYLENASSTSVARNDFSSNVVGIQIVNSSPSLSFSHNNVTGCSTFGIAIEGSTNNDFTNNTVTGSAGNDFYCADDGSGDPGANNDYENACDDRDGCAWVTTCPPE